VIVAPPVAVIAAAVGVLVAAAPGPAPAARVRELRDRRAADRRGGRSTRTVGRPGGRSDGHRRRVMTWLRCADRALLRGARRGRALLGRPPDVNLDRRLVQAVQAGAVVAVRSPFAGVVVSAIVWTAGWARARSAHQREVDQLVSEVPDLIELFRLATAAGLTVHLAVAAVAARSRGVLGAALTEVPARVAVGERLADALDRFAGSGEPVRPLGAALAAAERYGDPLVPNLERLSIEGRMLRRRHAEEAARRLPVQLLFPLVLCVLPAFVLLAVAPLLLAAMPHLPR